jgi:hypothetical protein
VGDRFRRRAAVGAERAYAAGHRRPGGVAAGSCRPDPASFDYLPKYGAIDIVPQMSGTYEELIPRAAKLEVAGQTIWVEAVQDLLARALAAETHPHDEPAGVRSNFRLALGRNADPVAPAASIRRIVHLRRSEGAAPIDARRRKRFQALSRRVRRASPRRKLAARNQPFTAPRSI